MKSLINLLQELLADAGSMCSVETARDFNTIKSRAKHEGTSFLTITLPEFASEFERALEHGRLDSTFFAGWRKKGCLPAFLRGFTSLVFTDQGEVKDEASTDAIFCVRQITRVFKKVRIDCSEERVRRTLKKFARLEDSFPDILLGLCSERLQHFQGVCSCVLGDLLGFREFNPLDLVPKHGPGATAERISGNAKYAHGAWNARLEEQFPFTEFLFTSASQIYDERHGIHRVALIEPEDELPVRVIPVPKTLKGPRIIAIEPVCMQYAQQAISSYLMRLIESHRILGKAVRFTDQSVNQQIALESSLSRDRSTLDLSDASDRVPLDMVRVMLESQPKLLAAVECCRSTRAKLPDGTIVPLKKFASMGSALCFPIESLYFALVLVHGLLWAQRLPPRLVHAHRALQRINVYGDDIVVPADETEAAIEALTSFGCQVNYSKSFRTGFFRESCGVDAYRGVNVTPIYVREVQPRSRQDSSGIVSWVSTSNQFHNAGLWRTAHLIKCQVESITGKLPVIGETSPGLGWFSFSGIPSHYPMCRYTHRSLVRTYKVRVRFEKDPLDGYPALLKFFLRSERESCVSPAQIAKEHLRVSARCGTVSRKRHWVPAY
jgi:hypothetical protein